MKQKFQKFSSKNMREKWMRKILHADQRPKQNHREENLPALPQEQFLLGKELGSMPVVNHDESSHEQTMLNEVNINFRLPRLPHSVVKHAESSRVRELAKKIENHPPTFSSTRSTTKRSLQPVHCGVKANVSGRGQRRAF